MWQRYLISRNKYKLFSLNTLELDTRIIKLASSFPFSENNFTFLVLNKAKLEFESFWSISILSFNFAFSLYTCAHKLSFVFHLFSFEY